MRSVVYSYPSCPLGLMTACQVYGLFLSLKSFGADSDMIYWWSIVIFETSTYYCGADDV